MPSSSSSWYPALRERALRFAEERMSGDTTGHDVVHAIVVSRFARAIAESEGCNADVAEIAGILHDIDDFKSSGAEDGPALAAKEFLCREGAPEHFVRSVIRALKGVSFTGAAENDRPSSQEGRCLQDADRLDALGARGIARAFAYGGHVGQTMFDPLRRPQANQSRADYRRNQTTTINHFYEKLLLLESRMNTTMGKSLARDRHEKTLAFLEEFLNETACEQSATPWVHSVIERQDRHEA